MIEKRDKSAFLALNPFDRGRTDGLFYREKMRAIHRIAPSQLHADARILEIGGGRSGMARNLYPAAHVTTLDVDPTLAPEGRGEKNSQFVVGDALALPFADGTFDAVTMFDVLEHIVEDGLAAKEAIRVTKPGGWILISTPYEDWHYPCYGFMRPFCPSEQSLMDEWGHVRRGYAKSSMTELFGRPPDFYANFINPVTSFYHDIAFSNLSRRTRKILYLAAALPVFLAYALHRPSTRGSEMACAWQL
jgi:ubiquinone/menaquinone biosynthesis C-methylase UbiE